MTGGVQVIGGMTVMVPALSEVYKYNIEHDIWTKCPELQNGRYKHSSTVIDHWLYVFFGTEHDPTSLKGGVRYV